MRPPSILIVDSGAGGLTVASEIRKRLPGAHYVYFADAGYYPYGSKSELELLRRVSCVIEHVINRFPVDIAVIACNTASTVVLDSLRSRFAFPFVGVVPAIKPAARLTRTGAIGVLATSGTVSRRYTAALIQDFASNCTVYLYGSPTLVDLAEEKLRGRAPDPGAIANELNHLLNQAPSGLIDTVVLACTHFPLLRQELAKEAPSIAHWVDSGEAIARRVEHWVNHLSLSTNAGAIDSSFLSTAAANHPYVRSALDQFLGPHQTLSILL